MLLEMMFVAVVKVVVVIFDHYCCRCDCSHENTNSYY